MRGRSAACVVGLVVACGGRTSHDVFGPVPLDASGSDVVDAADAGIDAAVSLEAGTCMSSTSSGALSGNIAGVPTTLNLFGGGSVTGFPIVQASWSDLRAPSPDEALLAWGTGGPDGGPQRSAGALIVVPKPGTGSTFYCAASVAASSSPANMAYAISIGLTDLSVLGQCPGTSVSGEVDICLEGSDAGAVCTHDFGVTGTVDGSEIRFRNLGGTISAANVAGDFHASVTGDGGDGGVILFANEGNGGYAVAFQSIGRLGPCPGTPVGGELGYCDRFE